MRDLPDLSLYGLNKHVVAKGTEELSYLLKKTKYTTTWLIIYMLYINIVKILVLNVQSY